MPDQEGYKWSSPTVQITQHSLFMGAFSSLTDITSQSKVRATTTTVTEYGELWEQHGERENQPKSKETRLRQRKES